MDNLRIREFRNALIEIVNAGEIPIEVKKIILSEMLLQIEKQANEQVVLEFGLREAQKKENNPE